MNYAFFCGVAIIILIFICYAVINLSRDDPSIWKGEIRKFENQDNFANNSPHQIVFTGSSSIRFWKSLATDMAPLVAINRGFGGSQINQVTYYADRIILPLKPKAIVFYAGENDIAGVFFSKRKSAQEVRDTYDAFCKKIHTHLPEALIYFISIKPPKGRQKYWPEMKKANQLIQEYCSSDIRLHFIDIVPAMLNDVGTVRSDFFKWDGIHLNEKGYAVWTSHVKPLLTNAIGQ